MPDSGVRRAIGGAGAVTLAAAVAGEALHRYALARDDEYRLLRSHRPGRPLTVTSADGSRIHAEVFGPEETSATTFVLAPGWTEELSIYTRVIRGLLERGHRVVAYDLRGQGASAVPAADHHELSYYGQDVEAVLEATCAGREHVILVGHSMGAMSIAAWAADHDVAARIHGAALLNTGLADLIGASRLLPHWLPSGLRQQIGANYVLGGGGGVPQHSTALSRAITRYAAFGSLSSAAAVAFYEPMLWRCPPRVRARAGRALSRMRLLHAVGNITVPTLVLAGAGDRLTPPAHAQQIAQRLPSLAKLLVLPDTGHMSPLECPERVVLELVELCDWTWAVSSAEPADGPVAAA